MPETILVGSASRSLGEAVCRTLQIAPVACEIHRFPDGEIQVELLESVRGRDVFVLQATSPPVEQHAMELLLLADACHRAGAIRLTGVVPYFGYARQDRRAGRRSLGARVVADVIATGRFNRLMLVDAHTPAIEGFFGVPMDHLTAVPALAEAMRSLVKPGTVIIAPDLGAVKLARAYARILRLPIAFVQKTRLDGDKVETHGIVGDVKGRAAWIVDDMVSTGGTIAAAVHTLEASGAVQPIGVSVTHGLLVGAARDLLQDRSVGPFLTSDTVASAAECPGVRTITVAPLIASAIRRAHRDESLADLRAAT